MNYPRLENYLLPLKILTQGLSLCPLFAHLNVTALANTSRLATLVWAVITFGLVAVTLQFFYATQPEQM
jgi:hypothetical protein